MDGVLDSSSSVQTLNITPLKIKPFNVSAMLDVPSNRKVVYRQVFNSFKCAFDVELSWSNLHFFIIAKRQNASTPLKQSLKPRKMLSQYYEKASEVNK